MLNGWPSIWLLIGLIMKWSRAAGANVKGLLVPDLPPPVVPIVTPLPAVVSVTLPAHVPLANEPVDGGVVMALVDVRMFVPV